MKAEISPPVESVAEYNAGIEKKYPKGSSVWLDKRKKDFAEVYDYMGFRRERYHSLIVIKVNGVNYGAAKWPIADVLPRR